MIHRVTRLVVALSIVALLVIALIALPRPTAPDEGGGAGVAVVPDQTTTTVALRGRTSYVAYELRRGLTFTHSHSKPLSSVRIRGVLENPNDDAREKIHKIESLVHHHDLRRVELYKELDQAIRS